MHSHTKGDRVRVCSAGSRHLLRAGAVTATTTTAVFVLLDGDEHARRFKPDEVEADQGAATFAAEAPAPAHAPEPVPPSAFPGACLYGYAGACSCSGGVCESRRRVDGWRPPAKPFTPKPSGMVTFHKGAPPREPGGLSVWEQFCINVGRRLFPETHAPRPIGHIDLESVSVLPGGGLGVSFRETEARSVSDLIRENGGAPVSVGFRVPSERLRVAGQSRANSMRETIASTGIGYLVAVGSQAVIFPLFGLHTSTGTNMAIAAYFTVISVARGYLVRRLFNWIAHR